MTVNPKLLETLVCPLTHQPVDLAPADLLTRINLQIKAKTVLNHAKQLVTEKLTEALIRKDGKVLFPVRDGIPVMLESEAIDVSC